MHESTTCIGAAASSKVVVWRTREARFCKSERLAYTRASLLSEPGKPSKAGKPSKPGKPGKPGQKLRKKINDFISQLFNLNLIVAAASSKVVVLCAREARF